MKPVDLWMDHPRLGCGTRLLVIVTEGRTKAKVPDAERLQMLTMTKAELAGAKPHRTPLKRLARALERNLRMRKRAKLRIAEKVVRNVITEFRKGAD